MKAIGIIFFLFSAAWATAQNYKPLSYAPPKEANAKDDSLPRKFFYGLSWQQYWGKFSDTNYPRPVFWKPCIGVAIHLEYYPLPWLGVGVGAGVQQRGTGVINHDKTAGQAYSITNNPNDTDSTYLERIRYTAFEMPLALLFRSPFQPVKNLRLSGSLGALFFHALSVQDVWISPVDGQHSKTDIADQFHSNGLGFFASCGPEIMAAKTRFQLHFIYSQSLDNIYKSGYQAKWRSVGIRLSWLF